jgi:hypothetical protein
MRALRKLQREQEPKSPFVFISERGLPFTPAGFARIVERTGVEAKLGFKAHPQGSSHPLRSSCTCIFFGHMERSHQRREGGARHNRRGPLAPSHVNLKFAT